jgi:hypothetical protein
MKNYRIGLLYITNQKALCACHVYPSIHMTLTQNAPELLVMLLEGFLLLGGFPPAFTQVSRSVDSTLNMETRCSSETSVGFQRITRHLP